MKTEINRSIKLWLALCIVFLVCLSFFLISQRCFCLYFSNKNQAGMEHIRRVAYGNRIEGKIREKNAEKWSENWNQTFVVDKQSTKCFYFLSVRWSIFSLDYFSIVFFLCHCRCSSSERDGILFILFKNFYLLTHLRELQGRDERSKKKKMVRHTGEMCSFGIGFPLLFLLFSCFFFFFYFADSEHNKWNSVDVCAHYVRTRSSIETHAHLSNEIGNKEQKPREKKLTFEFFVHTKNSVADTARTANVGDDNDIFYLKNHLPFAQPMPLPLHWKNKGERTLVNRFWEITSMWQQTDDVYADQNRKCLFSFDSIR